MYVVVRVAKARQFIARTRRQMLADFELKDSPTFRGDKGDRAILHRKISDRRSRQSVRALHAFHQHHQSASGRANAAADRDFELTQGADGTAAAEEQHAIRCSDICSSPSAESVLDDMLPVLSSITKFTR